ncbi:putative tetratricopeptide-like helical domain superfamily [Helianthus annuus]|nr:putative tetratricopeptide-like helical domain superfamily [Helianthus annuus]
MIVRMKTAFTHQNRTNGQDHLQIPAINTLTHHLLLPHHKTISSLIPSTSPIRSDLYKMLLRSSSNPALNYAKYLKEVRGDVLKAEEYCSRAILANPNDGTALSMYAELIWETHKDASRTRSYFDQAVKASPDDCYVMASYARFLWDAEEEEEQVSNLNLATHEFPIAPMAVASQG